ncbi:hypothetical protein, conserved [Plasmodium gonderi]|uniref:Uncharacterized protein n=1 Tax=Plasmodium gonderi TaxID=77519 RepID=A0A1Y1JIB5_PLAGO|nr:hypothetical protein, conserved [Plasmodium gonderi]GAW82246.1 hypothetical protein, conserved [Plasmodium gonderi]
MKKKKKSVEEVKVWNDALKNLDDVERNKYNLTIDTVHGRIRPEPEIIEHILEGLEDKIRYYFNLYKVEKEKRNNCEKENYRLNEEMNHTYTILQKNKIYTDKLENKLNNIKENQSSLIDTVRRIDLLYIQLDTLVQSFAGVCSQVASEVKFETNDINKKRNIMKMLLDYIYPCRTLDPRINSLYGMLYYQSIGFIKDGKFMSPPIPPIPPLIPSESDGWLAPSSRSIRHEEMHGKQYIHNNHIEDLYEKNMHPFASSRSSRSDSIRQNGCSYNRDNSKDNNIDDRYFCKYVSEEQKKAESNEYIYKPSMSQIISAELQGFDIQIGYLEIKYKKENARIICVVRYDNETSASAIQNSNRVTKPRDMNGIANGGKCIFNIDYTINLNSLPQKNPGCVPSFMIDVHDVNGKALIGTSRCSFISEKTLLKDASWDIYSRDVNIKPEIIGKMNVSVLPFPKNAILPSEMFRKSKQSLPSPLLHDPNSKNEEATSDNMIRDNNAKVMFQKQSPLIKSTQEKNEKSLSPQTMNQDLPSTVGGAKIQIVNNKTQGTNLFQRGKKVTFKPHTSKSGDPAGSSDSSSKAKTEIEEFKNQKELSKRNNTIGRNGDSNNKSTTVPDVIQKKGVNIGLIGKSTTSSLVQSRIQNLAKQFESKNGTPRSSEEDSGSKNSSTVTVGGSINKLGKPLKTNLPLPNNKENNVSSDEQKLVKKESTEKKQVTSLKQVENVQKSLPVMKDGVTKIKLPFPGKKDLTKKEDSAELTKKADAAELAKKANSAELAKKANSAELAKKANSAELAKKANSAELAKKANSAELTKTDSIKNVNDVKDNNISSKSLKPLLKIKVEPKKENLNKLFNKLPLKTSLTASKEKENKSSDAEPALKKSLSKGTGVGASKLKITTPLNMKNVVSSAANSDVKNVSTYEDKMNKSNTTEAEVATANTETPEHQAKGLMTSKAEAGGSTNTEKRLEKKISIKNKMLTLLKIKPVDPSAILKKSLSKNTPPAPAEGESESSQQEPDIKNLLEKAKKNAIFIDKNKVNVKLNKKVEVKREVKKFVPKLKNFE